MTATERLQFYIEVLEDETERMSDWEREFFISIAERFGEYGAETYISDKQWAVVERIFERLI